MNIPLRLGKDVPQPEVVKMSECLLDRHPDFGADSTGVGHSGMHPLACKRWEPQSRHNLEVAIQNLVLVSDRKKPVDGWLGLALPDASQDGQR